MRSIFSHCSRLGPPASAGGSTEWGRRAWSASRDRRTLLAELELTAALCLLLCGVALGISLSPRLPAALSLVRNAVPALRLDVFAVVA